MNVTQTLRDTILNNFDQVLIFAEYFEIDSSEIEYSINSNSRINNPLRTDHNPSLSFKWFKTKLIARDFGDIRWRGDVFEIVGVILGKNCGNNYDFVEICNDIIEQCSITKAKRHIAELADGEITILQRPQLDIDIKSRCFTKPDIAFFNQFGISNDYIEEVYTPVRHYYLDDWLTPYKAHKSDPCYAYTVNPGKLKLYFPYRHKKDGKFITNNHFPIECFGDIRTYEYTILIKAIKDKTLIRKILKSLGITNVQVLSLTSETSKLTVQMVDILNRYTTKQIFTLLDTDKTGIESMTYYHTVFGFVPIYFTKGYEPTGAKDPTDLCKVIKYRKTEEIFLNIYNRMINVY